MKRMRRESKRGIREGKNGGSDEMEVTRGEKRGMKNERRGRERQERKRNEKNEEGKKRKGEERVGGERNEGGQKERKGGNEGTEMVNKKNQREEAAVL